MNAVRKGIFRKDLSLREFARSFFLDNREIRGNKERRWQLFLRADRNATLLDRPAVRPLWKPYKVYHEPIMHSRYIRLIYQGCMHFCLIMPDKPFIRLIRPDTRFEAHLALIRLICP